MKRVDWRRVAERLTVAGMAVVGAALLTGQALQPNERARQEKCMNNVKQIGVALTMFEMDHEGFPPAVEAAKAGEEPARARLAWLLKDGYLTSAKILVCPSDQKTQAMAPPKDPKQAPVKEFVPGEDECSYGMDADKGTNADGSAALISDKPVEKGRNQDSDVNSANHDGQGQNVFYVDGHVGWAKTLKSDSGQDENVFSGDHDNKSRIDSNIDP